MTSTQFVGWFVNGSYSVYLWLPAMPRQLHLGFDANGTEVQCTVYSVQCTVYSVQCTV